ncbi:urease accessory protein UreE [Xanthobacter aminoxidans]|uniref:urease accessory protein UreE n=1 Tax=Xanthobacter aminoxidans TaxID=186280 RepID=UPI002022C66B|nr:urease accessory protein UreE [Xanthobacter aminoxidans]MCL8385590.1 urease accessory protein UreE [Xanthobacter aminoxidans]
MLQIDRIVGSRLDEGYSERLHDLEHHGAVEWLMLAAAELARRRFRAVTSGGTEIAVALPRDETLFDGAVLLFEQHRAIVVRVDAERWLRLGVRDMAVALELGYHVGNLHWRVRFEATAICVALEGPAEAYLARLAALGLDDRIEVAAPEAGSAPC